MAQKEVAAVPVLYSPAFRGQGKVELLPQMPLMHKVCK